MNMFERCVQWVSFESIRLNWLTELIRTPSGSGWESVLVLERRMESVHLNQTSY